jgi:hypothetical protein
LGRKRNNKRLALQPARYFSDTAAARLERLRMLHDPERRFASFPE